MNPWRVEGDSIFFNNGFVFHINFYRNYKIGDTISIRRKLKHFYTKSQQNLIISYIKNVS